jgi:hypothetical protein
MNLIRFNAVLFARRAVRCGRELGSPFVNGPISSLSDDESDVDELETCAEIRRLNNNNNNKNNFK